MKSDSISPPAPAFLSIEEAAERIRRGEVIAFPTETVYGLGADALNEKAVRRIFAIKNRPAGNPLICHLADSAEVFRFGEGDPTSRRLTEFWPGPLTVLLPHRERIPRIVTAGSALCAFRIPSDPTALRLLRLVDRPLAAPSANLSGLRSPTSAALVVEQLGDKIDGVLDGGRCTVGVESTVVRIEAPNRLRILRQGAITSEEFRARGYEIVAEHSPDLHADPDAGKRSIDSPGQLSRHYAPLRARLIFVRKSPPLLPGIDELDRLLRDNFSADTPMRPCCYLTFGENIKAPNDDCALNLSPAGSLEEAARNLYSHLDELERRDCRLIVTAGVPDIQIGRAINDRLLRAASFLAIPQSQGLKILKK